VAPSLLRDSDMKKICLTRPIHAIGPEMVVKKTGKVGTFQRLSPRAGNSDEIQVTLRFEGGELGTFKRSEVETVFH